MSDSFHSYGKLLLTGEYAVLEGAKALALPLKYQQNLKIETVENGGLLRWIAKDTQHFKLKTSIELSKFNVIETNYKKASDLLVLILKEISKQNKSFFSTKTGYTCHSKINWPIEYGFGSSSTLINNLSLWANVNPYELNNKIFNGSGYDIACANTSEPIFFELKKQKPIVATANFKPLFHHYLAFVYLNKKQDSKLEIQQFISKSSKISTNNISRISQISTELVQQTDVFGFQELLSEHERIMSEILDRETIKKLYFPNFDGTIKSLGAWGGDFILASSKHGYDYISNYFKRKGFTISFKYKDIAH